MYENEDELFNYFLLELKKGNDNTKLLEKLKFKKVLFSNFEDRYILNNEIKEFSSLDKKMKKENNVISYFLDSSDGVPYQIELIFDQNIWKVLSYKFQCQSCFGEDEDCLVCGGSGWGVL